MAVMWTSFGGTMSHYRCKLCNMAPSLPQNITSSLKPSQCWSWASPKPLHFLPHATVDDMLKALQYTHSIAIFVLIMYSNRYKDKIKKFKKPFFLPQFTLLTSLGFSMRHCLTLCLHECSSTSRFSQRRHVYVKVNVDCLAPIHTCSVTRKAKLFL